MVQFRKKVETSRAIRHAERSEASRPFGKLKAGSFGKLKVTGLLGYV